MPDSLISTKINCIHNVREHFAFAKICIPKMCIRKAELTAEAQSVQGCPVQARAHSAVFLKEQGTNKREKKLDSRGPWRKFQGLTELDGGGG